jgi:chromosomal replication initiation ATPase DnaA
MGLLSVSAYAATHGASKQAAAKWKARGLLVLSGALVDVAASDAKMKTAAMGRFKIAKPGAAKHQPKVRAVDAPLVDPVVAGAGEEVDEAALGQFAEQLLQGQFASIAIATQVKENALALKHLVAARIAAGAVVEIEVAETVLFEMARQQRDAWMNWPSQIAPLLATDLDLEADRVLEALTQYVQQHLQQLGEPKPDFNVERES